MLVVYDVAEAVFRQRLERELRVYGFLYLFRNMMWADRVVSVARLQARIRRTLQGIDYRVVLLTVPQRTMDEARWLFGTPKEGKWH